jgi:hypothetical protein
MKAMNEAREGLQQAPPPGSYPVIFDAVEARLSKAGNTMLELSAHITSGEFEGFEFKDYIVTDGNAKGAGFGKRKLRGIGHVLYADALDTGAEVSDEDIATALTNYPAIAVISNEQAMGKLDPEDPLSPYSKPMTTTNDKGEVVPLNKVKVEGYRKAPVAEATTATTGANVVATAVAAGTPAAYKPGATPNAWQQAQVGAGGKPAVSPPKKKLQVTDIG